MTSFLTKILLIFFVLMTSAFAAVNINTASVSELDSLPGIGPVKAQAIVAYRDTNGPFGNVSDLTNVKGIGDATLSNIEALCIIDGDSPQASANSPSSGEASAELSIDAININTGTIAELQTLPGIGSTKAAAIISFRESSGPFSSCNDLSQVNGIGSATVNKIAAKCRVE